MKCIHKNLLSRTKIIHVWIYINDIIYDKVRLEFKQKYISGLG